MNNPIVLFQTWFDEELVKSELKIPSACCFSTIGKDGYPNSRFVSLKEVNEGRFIVTGPLNSKKGEEVKSNFKVSLTFWWIATQKQVRIQGDAYLISGSKAAAYFADRNDDAKIVSVAFQQGKEIESFEKLTETFLKKQETYRNTSIKHPKTWGGFSIDAKRIEFMEFEESRLHKRTLYQRDARVWNVKLLQP